MLCLSGRRGYNECNCHRQWLSPVTSVDLVHGRFSKLPYHECKITHVLKLKGDQLTFKCYPSTGRVEYYNCIDFLNSTCFKIELTLCTPLVYTMCPVYLAQHLYSPVQTKKNSPSTSWVEKRDVFFRKRTQPNEEFICRNHVIHHPCVYYRRHQTAAWKFERIVASNLAMQRFWVEMTIENTVFVSTVKML